MFIVVAGPDCIVKRSCTTIVNLCIRVIQLMRGHVHQVITGRTAIDGCHNTVIRTGWLFQLWCHKVTRKACGERIRQFCIGRHSGIVTLISCTWNNTFGLGIAQRQGKTAAINALCDCNRIGLGPTNPEKVLGIVVRTGFNPRIQTGSIKLWNIIFTRLLSICLGVFIICVTTISGIIREIRDYGSPR